MNDDKYTPDYRDRLVEAEDPESEYAPEQRRAIVNALADIIMADLFREETKP